MKPMFQGKPVEVRYEDGTTATAQFWGAGPDVGTVWLALENGRFLLLKSATGDVYSADARGTTSAGCVGKVAA